MIEKMLEKRCRECEIIKDIKEFSICRNCKDGYKNECKGCVSIYNKKYREENKNKINEREKEYYENNKKKINEKNKKYREENKDRIKEYNREYRRNRISNDPLFRLRTRMRTLIWTSLKNGGYTKDSKTNDILGCSYEELLEHLNDNKYGFIYGDDNLDIDHIIPSSRATSKEELIELNHYSNLQLLPSEYNRNVKRDNDFDNECLEEWLYNS